MSYLCAHRDKFLSKKRTWPQSWRSYAHDINFYSFEDLYRLLHRTEIQHEILWKNFFFFPCEINKNYITLRSSSSLFFFFFLFFYKSSILFHLSKNHKKNSWFLIYMIYSFSLQFKWNLKQYHPLYYNQSL